MNKVFVSSFIEVSEDPDDKTIDPEADKFNKFVKQGCSPQDDINTLDLAMKGDSSKINVIRNEQIPSPFEEGVAHFDEHVKNIINDDHHDILVRHYYPFQAKDHSGLPLFVFIHGGGWCYSSIDSRNQFCSKLSKEANIEVASINYSLSPEAKPGTALDECFSVYYNYVLKVSQETQNSDRLIFVGGDSSGGNLAAGLIIKINNFLRENEKNEKIHKKKPDSLLLLYPVVDLVNDYSSFHRFETGYGLEASVMKKYEEAYVPDIEMRKNPLFSPILDDNLSLFPPTLVITSQFDVLRDEGMAFAKKLNEAKVPVKYVCVETAVHGFFSKTPMKRLITIGHKIIDEFLFIFTK